MLGKGKSAIKVPLISVALCLSVIGAVLVVRAATGPPEPPQSKRSEAPSPAIPSTTASSSDLTLPGATATQSTRAKKAKKAKKAVTRALDQAVAGRAAALEDLASKAQQLSTDRKKAKTARPVARITFANFNLQGASHRGGVGTRTAIARDLFNRSNVGVASVQEFAASQQGTFMRITGGSWGCYPCGSGPKKLDGENSVIWRKDRFQLLKVETRPYPYFGGHIRNMPRVLLRDKTSGTSFYVTSYHNPADVHGPAGRYRASAVGRQIADANAVRAATKIPLIVSGDMNDRAAYFCRMAPAAHMHSADSSTASGGCHVSRHPWIDWIMGTADVDFSGYHRDNSATVRRSSDHPIVITQVKLTGQPGEGRYGSGNDQS